VALQAQSLTFSIAERTLVDDVSFTLNPGEMVGLLGLNGAGKTTVLRLLLGLLKPQNGKVKLDGTCLDKLSIQQRAQKIASVGQHEVPPFSFTSAQIVMMGRYAWHGEALKPNALDEEICANAMQQTDAWDLRHRELGTLSGGERQRVLLARALAQQSRYLLLDEPFTYLDLPHQLTLIELMQSIVKKNGLSILVVLHDINLALHYCQRVFLLEHGKLLAEGASADLINPDFLARHFSIKSEIAHDSKQQPHAIFLKARE